MYQKLKSFMIMIGIVVCLTLFVIPIGFHMFFCGCDMGQDLNRPIQTNNMIAPKLVFSGSIFTLQVYNLQANQSYSLWFPATNYNQDFIFRENPTTQFISVPYTTSQNHGLLTIYLQQNYRNIDTIQVTIIDTSQWCTTEKLIRKVQGHARLEIPKAIRDFLGIREGDNVTIYREGDKIIVEKIDIPD